MIPPHPVPSSCTCRQLSSCKEQTNSRSPQEGYIIEGHLIPRNIAVLSKHKESKYTDKHVKQKSYMSLKSNESITYMIVYIILHKYVVLDLLLNLS